jgi:hypothetical protein
VARTNWVAAIAACRVGQIDPNLEAADGEAMQHNMNHRLFWISTPGFFAALYLPIHVEIQRNANRICKISENKSRLPKWRDCLRGRLQVRRTDGGCQMTDIPFSQLLDQVRVAQNAYHRLVVIAGLSGSGKTRVLNQVAADLNLPVINLSLVLSQRLLGLTRRQRALKAQEIAIELIGEHLQFGVCLDNTEILFDSTLHLNPLLFLQDLSRNRLIIASWNGRFDAGELQFGYASHPDFFSQAVTGCPVVTAFEERLQLHLTT